MKKYIIMSGITLAAVFGISVYSSVFATVPGTNEAISVSASGGSPDNSSGGTAISQNGKFIAFSSRATNLVSGVSLSGTYAQVFVRDRLNDTTALVSKDNNGTPANAESSIYDLSADGRYVLFASSATNLVSGVSNGTHVYRYDTKTNTITVVDSNSSGAVPSDTVSIEPSISANGRYVTFMGSATSLASGAPTLNGMLGYYYIYLKDMVTSSVKLLSVGTSNSAPNGDSGSPFIDCSGSKVAFWSGASNLVASDTNNKDDVFIFDLLTGTTKNITINGDAQSYAKAISCNGEYIALNSWATNLTSSTTTNAYSNAYRYDTINEDFTLASKDSGSTIANSTSYPRGISNDGNVVLFHSAATNLSSADTNSTEDIYLRNIESGTTELVNVTSSGAIANGFSGHSKMSADGQYISFNSRATNLVSGFGHSSGAIYAARTGVTPNY